jgi:hypothetical protein
MYGTSPDRQYVSLNHVLKSAGLQTLSLEELVLRHDIEINGPENYRLEALLHRGKMKIKPDLDKAMIDAIDVIIRANRNLTYLKDHKHLYFPHPSVASSFLSQLDAIKQERLAKVNSLSAVQLEIDEIVMDAYGIRKTEWKEMIRLGVPWARDRSA